MNLFPLRGSETNYCVTCGKTVCTGCKIGTDIAHMRDGGDIKTEKEKTKTCPYCQSNTATTTALYDYKSQLEKEMKRVDAGDGEAIRRVGSYYFEGKGTAAGQISGKAAYNVGIIYLNGDDVDKDHVKAFAYFQKAAELGDIACLLPGWSFLYDYREDRGRRMPQYLT